MSAENEVRARELVDALQRDVILGRDYEPYLGGDSLNTIAAALDEVAAAAETRGRIAGLKEAQSVALTALNGEYWRGNPSGQRTASIIISAIDARLAELSKEPKE